MELFPLLENKNLHTLNLRDRSLFKRGLHHELSRSIIGQEKWRQQRGFVQTVAKRSFTLLQQKFQKDLNKIIKELSSGTLDLTTAKRKSKKIFEAYYKRAYLLGLKSSGSGIARAFSDLNFNFYGDPDIQHAEERWSRIATASELKFWDKYIEKLVSQASSRVTLERRIKFYVDSLEGHYNAGRVTGSPNNTLIHWVLDKGHEPCRECEYLAANSPYPKELLITTPKAGFCTCLMNCKCTLKIVPSESYEYISRKSELPSKNQILRDLSK
jgi:hypothetical protein